MESVPGAECSNVPKRTPRSPSYAGLTQRAVFADWLRGVREGKPMSRKELAWRVWPPKNRERARSDTTTARIKSYETIERDERGRVVHVVLPSPEVLRRICDALGISWLSTFASAGYYHDVLQALASLVALGYRWLDIDNAFAREGARLTFRSFGVTELGGRVIWDACWNPVFRLATSSGRSSSGPPRRKSFRKPTPKDDPFQRLCGVLLRKRLALGTSNPMQYRSPWRLRFSWPRADFLAEAMSGKKRWTCMLST